MKLSLITLFMLHRNEHASLREVYTAVKRAGFEAVDLCSYDFAHGPKRKSVHCSRNWGSKLPVTLILSRLRQLGTRLQPSVQESRFAAISI